MRELTPACCRTTRFDARVQGRAGLERAMLVERSHASESSKPAAPADDAKRHARSALRRWWNCLTESLCNV
jgi:hypothetical protein